MEGVPKLVEQRGHRVQRQQWLGAIGGFGDVQHVHHHGFGAQQLGLVNEGGHPRPTPLRRPGIIVGEEQPNTGAVLV